MKWIILILVINLTGCANKPHKKYEYNPSGRCNDILCLAVAISKSMSNNKFQKCSDMSGDQRASCEAQVESLKKHISDANKN
tara:strand:- start:6141 stop:6386 length:246 start_codon:yes stop_codon:yes gene_type:complete